MLVKFTLLFPRRLNKHDQESVENAVENHGGVGVFIYDVKTHAVKLMVSVDENTGQFDQAIHTVIQDITRLTGLVTAETSKPFGDSRLPNILRFKSVRDNGLQSHAQNLAQKLF